MIHVKMTSGLGNQLFQYASAKNLARLNNTDLYLDLEWFNKRTAPRKFELDYFCVKYKTMNKYILKLYNRIHAPLIYREKTPFDYDVNFLNLRGQNILLSGYWAKFPYFDDIRDELIKEIQPKLINSKNQNMLKIIDSTNSVSIHIRRGDYLTEPLFKLLDDSYYEPAITYMMKKGFNPTFYIFSDDIEYCKKYKYHENFHIVDLNYGNDSYMDLVLMSKCKHNIIANSTFSWWAAYLNNNLCKTIIYPKIHHNVENIPKRWKAYTYNPYKEKPDSWIAI